MRILSRIVSHYIGTNNFSTKNIFNIYIWCFIFSFEIYQWTDLCIIKCGQSTSPPENQSIARNSSSNWDKRLVITFKIQDSANRLFNLVLSEENLNKLPKNLEVGSYASSLHTSLILNQAIHKKASNKSRESEII